jgi:hypothetical protein
MGSIPDRLEKSIGEAEVQEILDWLFPQEVIDAENSRLGEKVMETWFNFCADVRLWPKGFSTTIRAPAAQLEVPSPSITGMNMLGGIAR